MTKKLEKLSSLVMTVILSIFLLIPGSLVKAETNSTILLYTALGDSIGAGYSANPGKGYVNLIYNYLKVQKRYSGLQLNNLSVPGITTTDLLGALQTNSAAQASITNSSIITLSIGGNNLLQPVVVAVATAFNVNPVNNPNLITELSQAIVNTPEPTKTAIFTGIFTQLATPSSPLSTALTAGVQKFSTDFPSIITQIKTLNPKAKIYIPTLYNPFSVTDTCYASFEQLIQAINLQIKALALNTYEVVDVYTAFASHTGSPVVNFNFLIGAVDPHPTTEGHKVIFESHVKPVTSVTLSEASKTLQIGQALQLTAVISPANAITNQDVLWTSSDSNIASVDTTGKVTALTAGTAKITATSVDGNKTAVFTLTSVPAPVPVSQITLNTSTETLQANSTLQLTATIKPDNAANKNVLWKSSDENIATVDTTGKVTAKSKGTATITATSADGNVAAQATITVTEAQQAAVINTASATLPKTGSSLDYNVLLSVGLILLTIGSVLMIKKRTEA